MHPQFLSDAQICNHEPIPAYSVGVFLHVIRGSMLDGRSWLLLRGHTVEGGVCSFVHEGIAIARLRNEGTLSRTDCVVDSHSYSYCRSNRNGITKRQTLCSQHHVEFVHNQTIDLLFANASHQRSCGGTCWL